MNKVLFWIQLLFIHGLYSQAPQLPSWYPAWQKVAQDDIKEYSEKFTHVLQKYMDQINKVLLTHAQAEMPKVSTFKKNISDVLEESTKDIKDLAYEFAKEIKSEAHNTYDYKINPITNENGIPTRALKTTRTHRQRVVQKQTQ